MSDAQPNTLRLILWPTLLTLAISITRVVGEVQGWINQQSGGGGAVLGITWCIFVFGGWFGFRLSRSGDAPRVRPAWLWSLLPLLAIVGTFFFFMQGVDFEDTSEATQAKLRNTLQWASMVAGGGALWALVVWTRLAWALLCYGLFARITVMVITWLAKTQGWNTHYTKLGPAGVEKDMAETLASTSFAQFGLWVPFTVVAGGFVGSWFARRAKSGK